MKRHIVIKIMKVKDERIILKVIREKLHVTYKRIPIRLVETMEARGSRKTYSKCSKTTTVSQS